MNTLRGIIQALQEKLDQRDALEAEIQELQQSVSGAAGSTAPSKKGRKAKKSTAKPTKKTGKVGKTTRKATKKASGSLSCPQAIEKVLRKHPAGLKLVDLTTAVLKAGYATKSKNPGNVVYQSLYAMTKANKVAKGEDHKYHLAKVAA